MQYSTRSGALIIGIALIAAFSSLGYLLGKAALEAKALERTVVVKGLSEREVPADAVTWPITFQVAGNDLEQVYAQIERNADVVRQFLVGNGLAEDDIALAPPSVTDLFAQQWGDKQGIKYRYTGSGTVTVHTTQVAAVLKAMGNMIELGKRGVVVNASFQPGAGGARFVFTKLSQLKPAMVEEATKNARAVAEKFAHDSHSRLGKIRSASQGQFSISDRDATTPQIKQVRVVSTIEYYLSD